MVRQQENLSKPRVRFEWIDALRGFTLFHMVVYHMLWDLTHLFGVAIPWFGTTISYIWQQAICWTFLLISGFCFSLGHHPLQRGLLISGGGMLIMLVTFFATPESRVVFGILTCIGLCMLLMIPLEKLLRCVPVWCGLPLSAALFVLTRNIPKRGTLGFESWDLIALPESLRSGGYGMMLLGFRNPEIHSTDYFPLLPWLFLFSTGYWLYRLVQPQLYRTKTACRWLAPLCMLGRHTFVIYLVHQPVIYGMLWVVLWLFSLG